MKTMIAAVLVVVFCTSPASARKWTDSTGKYTVEAEFLEVQDGKVRLRKENGSVISIPMDRLTWEDQEWVRRQLKTSDQTAFKEGHESPSEKGPITTANAEPDKGTDDAAPDPQPRGAKPKSGASIRYPALLGVGMLMLPPPVFAKAKERLLIANKDQIGMLKNDAWADALDRATRGKYGKRACETSVLVFAFQLDDIWSNGQLQAEMMGRYTTRLQAITPETADAWEKALRRVSGPDDLLRMYTVGFVMQLDRLFNSGSFNKEESEVLLARLGSLTPRAVEACKKATHAYGSQAAVMLNQNDALFDQNQFQGGALDAVIRQMQEELRNSDPAPQKPLPTKRTRR